MQLNIRISAETRRQLDTLVARYGESEGRVVARLIQVEATKGEKKVEKNQMVREMAKVALRNSIFDAETDPGGCVEAGLKFLATDGDWDDGIIEENISGPEDWAGLEAWARSIGCYAEA